MKANQKNNVKNAETMDKFLKMDSFKVSGLSAAVTMLIATAISPTLHSADIEIYKVPEDSVGTTTLMFMLDVSGSMSNGDTNQNGSRLNRLKQGMRDVLYGSSTNEPLADKIIIGLGIFEGNNGRINTIAKALGDKGTTNITNKKEVYYRVRTGGGGGGSSATYGYYPCTAWHDLTESCKTWGPLQSNTTGLTTSGTINYQCYFNTGTSYNNCNVYYVNGSTRKRTHRDDLFDAINALQPLGNTPTPYAYATAAAYLMGQQIKTIEPNKQIYFVAQDYAGYHKICSTWSGTACTLWNPSGSWYTGFSAAATATTQSGTGRIEGVNGSYYIGQTPYSGFDNSIAVSKSENRFIAPTSITDQATNADKKECSGQGIYFLTDGQPVVNGYTGGSDGKTGDAYKLMSTTLGSKGSAFDCLSSPLGNISSDNNNGRTWACIGKFAQALLDKDKNPSGLQIQTAVVGFGNDFTSTTGSVDVQNAKDWGTIGGGGWTAGNNSKDIVDSVNNFIKELNKDIPSMSTGSSTIPIDTLSARTVQPYAYSPQMEPKVKPEELQQLWFGNLKKYYAVNNGIYATENGTGDPVVKESKLQDLADIWANNTITYPEGTGVFAKHGALNRVILGTTNASGTQEFARKILTDFDYDHSKAEAARYGRNFELTRLSPTYTTANKTKNETKYAKALMSLFGYQIPNDTSTVGLDLSTLTSTLKQLGSVQHSLPILLTQEGKASAVKDATGNVTISYGETREDYVLFGSTQGLVHVLNAKDGTEKFSFLPKEIIEKQSETFKYNAGNTANGKDALYYGMDGQWVAHTVYVTKPDGTQTVKETPRNVVGSTTDKENLKGKQWVYGGMRMGGRSYYSLDLTNINDPKMKFHIDPSSGNVHKRVVDEKGVVTHVSTPYPAISNMGQSWSKPTIAYVNWKGSRKLVMFVGGGYDAGGPDGDGLWSNNVRTGYAGYEIPNYKQENATSAKKTIGSGVYMFDADNGDLLWYANSATGANLSNSNLKYSVATEIKTVDRNNDGYTDHLYFGDLAGQAFRIDFKNDGATNFNAQMAQVLDLNEDDGTSPRFYVAPTFTAHRSEGKTEGANIVVAAFMSGNQSSPLLATTDSPTTFKSSLGLQYDGLYAVYDYDIHENKSGYPTTFAAAKTLAASTDTASVAKLKYINGALVGAIANKTSGWGGWYYQFNTKFNGTSATEAVIKGLTNLYAMENSLYVTMFDASDNGTTSSCGAGVKGNSFAKRLCLPTGVCSEDANYTYNLGSGIVSLNVGGDSDGGGGKEIYVPDPDKVCVGEGCSPCVGDDCDEKKFIPFGGKPRLVPNRWYERFAQG